MEGEKDITVGALKGFFSFLTLAGRVTWRELGHLSVPQLLHLYDGVIKPTSPALMSLIEATVIRPSTKPHT